MTYKEAIEILNDFNNVEGSAVIRMTSLREALNIAIKALKFAESQRLCCDNCVNHSRKSSEVCTSPYGQCEFFDDTQ